MGIISGKTIKPSPKNVYDFVIIGEATKNIPVEIISCYPEIPWRLMGNMRNVMTHEYFQVDLEIMWNTIQDSLPLLIPQIQDLMEREEIEQLPNSDQGLMK